MTVRARILAIGVAAVLAAACAVAVPRASAQESAVEKLYADLYKLDPAERHKRLVEGAAKEGGKAYLKPSFRSGVGPAITAAFLKENPEIQASFDIGSSQSAGERFIADFVAGKHEIDMTGGSLAEISNVLDRKFEARYPTPASAAILPKYRPFTDPDNRWSLSHTNDLGIGYNTKTLKPGEEPKAWEDLCALRFKSTASYEFSQTRWLAGLYSLYGKDEQKVLALLKCIGENDPIIMTGITTRLTLMMAGDHAITGNMSIAAGVEMYNKNPQKVPFGTNYDIPMLAYAEGFLISKETPRPYTDALYVDWTLGETSQKMIASAMRGPVTTSHPYHPEKAQLVPFGLIDPAVLERLHQAWAKYIGRR